MYCSPELLPLSVKSGNAPDDEIRTLIYCRTVLQISSILKSGHLSFVVMSPWIQSDYDTDCDNFEVGSLSNTNFCLKNLGITMEFFLNERKIQRIQGI